MPITFEQSKDAIARLVKHFVTNRTAYLAPAYKEAHARQEFIDPFFVALGWDVHNAQRAAPDYREVVMEDSLEIEGQKKAPDYVFRIGRDRKFFAEAKKPGVDLKADARPAYQLRRYAWTAKLPLSILTDFEELAVYDCRTRPSDKDKASTGRINYLGFQEYPDRWREIWDTFSREAVWSGSFDQFAQTSKGKRGTSTVDAEFLKEIESWRDLLARNIALRNPRLTIDELNDAVQRTIDRIIFLRMAEDRGIEEYGRLQRLAEGEGVYAGLIKVSRQADQKYNSGLFDFSKAGDRVTPGLTVDDKALKPILAALYFPRSPYEFSVLPVEILGNVYEQFLGKVIRLTPGHQAKIEEKPEVKKAGGVKYTPAYIVEYIVRNTVGPLIEGKSPQQLRGFRVLDLACGSGSFLLGLYTFLLDYYRDWYAAHDPEKHKQAVMQVDGGWQLTLAERKHILTEHVFGVDIDRQAVEVTKLSLLLKVLEGVQQLTLFAERALPNLDANIKCGNSLIGPDYFAGQLMPDPDELRRVNPFDWAAEFPEAMQAGGFGAIIGNPPYIRIQMMKEWAPLEVEAYKTLYRAASAGNYDIYVVFVEKGLSLLNRHGRLGFILPHKFFNAQYGAPLRGLIAKGQHLAEVVHFGDQQVFEGVSTYTCLLFLNKTKTEVCRFLKVADLVKWQIMGQALEGKAPAASITAGEWTFTIGPGNALLERLSQLPVKLENVTDRIFQGVKTSADKIYIVEERKRKAGRVLIYSPQLETEYWLESTLLHPLIKGGDSRRYSLTRTNRLIIFPYVKGEDGKTGLISEKTLKSDLPLTWEYLMANKACLEGRENGRMRGPKWYGYIYPKALEVMPLPKIFTPDIAPRAAFSLDPTGELFFTGGTAGGYGLLVSEGYSREYILGLLNSRVLDWIVRQTATSMRGGWFSFESRFIRSLPIRTIDFSDPADKARHDQMVGLVEKMLDLHKRKAETQDAGEQTRLQRLIDATDKQIDALVYELYELTPEEISIVEGADGETRRLGDR